jgi:type IV pilus assembly protein PilB
MRNEMTQEENKDHSRKKMRLGEYLLNKGLLSQSDLTEALEEQKLTGEPLGQILIHRHLIEEKQMYQILAEQLKVEFLDLYGMKIPLELISLVPEQIVKTYSIMPVKKENNILTIAMTNPANTFAIDALRSLKGMTIKPVMSSKTQILAAIEKYYGGGEIDEALELVESKEVKKIKETKETEDLAVLKKSAEEAPIVKLVNAIIQNSVNNGASDIHIEPTKGDCRVRNRIDGVLYELTTFSHQSYPWVISRIKIMADMDIAERRLPQDGSW